MALSKEAAQAITTDLDKLAQLFEADHTALGVPANVAKDFAYRCDLLSDFVEKQAASLDRDDSVQHSDVASGGVVDVGHEADEPYMADKTTQDELYELGKMVESDGLGKAALEDIAAKVADLLKAAAEDEDEDEDDAEEEAEEAEESDDDSDKKATMIALANDLLRLAGDDEDEEEEEADDSDEEEDEDGSDKEAAFAHGYSV